MTPLKAILLAAASLAVLTGRSALATVRGPCVDSLTQSIPSRPADAPAGRAFARSLQGLSEDEREAAIRRALRTGNIPGFMRHFVPIRLQAKTLQGQPVDVVICAAPDYLAVGTDGDFLLMPMRLATALSAATEFGLTLPTAHIVDAIYSQAAVRFVPQPLPAGNEMRSTDYSLHHNQLVAQQRMQLGVELGDLIAGDKKDLVLTNRLRDHLDRVAIYGWHTAPGRPIQPLSTVHGWRYADYSHGIRWISETVFVDGRPTSIFAALEDSRLAHVLCDEGVIADVLGLIKTLNARVQPVLAALR